MPCCLHLLPCRFADWGSSVLIGARYGAHPATSVCEHAPIPLIWHALLAAAAQQPLRPEALLSAVLIPVGIVSLLHHSCGGGAATVSGAKAAVQHGAAKQELPPEATPSCRSNSGGSGSADLLGGSARQLRGARRQCAVAAADTPAAAGLRASAAALPSRCRPWYLSPVTHTAVTAKFSQEGVHAAGPAAASFHAAAQRASSAVVSTLHRQHLQPTSVAGFYGCVRIVAHAVVPSADRPQVEAAAAAVVAALQRQGQEGQLPPGLQLLHSSFQPPHLVGMHVQPACLQAAGGAVVQVHVPAALLQVAAAASEGVRVVVSAQQQLSPVADVTLRPGDAGWLVSEAGGQLTLRVPDQGGAPQLLLLHLLRTPAAAGTAAAASATAADELLTSLPVLSLPAAAAEEVCAVFREAQLHWLKEEQRPCHAADLAAAAAAVYGQAMTQFAHDYGLLLQTAGGGAARPGQPAQVQLLLQQPMLQLVARAVMAFLAQNGMPACQQLLMAGEAGAQAPAAPETPDIGEQAVGPGE